ncbi:MAG: hypothetical protein OQJ89_01320 [Kangiellaceae bacterium]|nr:hypothetical protein [Kangiellaceae bacterium]MCW8997290.1 hypothetical protein [Kangiellaceae bacterium]MCW9015582.1 hypothetical protein [Kangiellaceae bacterium]
MSDKNSDRPPIDSPEFEEWLRKQCAKYKDESIGDELKVSDFDERDLVSGDINDLHKSDAELFPNEIEEFTPEERRKAFKVYSKNKSNKEK